MTQTFSNSILIKRLWLRHSKCVKIVEKQKYLSILDLTKIRFWLK